MPSPPPAIVVSAPRLRQPGRLDWPGDPALPDPSGAAVLAAIDAADDGPVWLGGGEPTLRADLPDLIGRVADLRAAGVGLDTDGLALARPRVAASLRSAGLRRVRVALHAGRAEAHDWLVGQPGAARRARKALSACAEAGLEVHASITLTRPTLDLLPETVALLGRLGAATVRIRRLRRRGPAAAAFITLSPRLGLAEPYLEAAVHRGVDAGLRVEVEGFPRCALPRAAAARVAPPRWALPAGLEPLGARLAEAAAAPGCPACPGRPACAGAPADYVGCFGRAEIDSETGLPRARPAGGPLPRGALPAAPPVRASRAPATRLREARRNERLGSLGGDPLGGTEAPPPPAAVRLVLDPDVASRPLRQEMVRLAQQGATTFVVTGDFSHPDAVELVRDALRLSQPRVELEGDLRPLASWSPRQRLALRGLADVRGVALPQPADQAALDAWVTELRAGLRGPSS